jgi:YidC/Oxa1 family membrane protein insertase
MANERQSNMILAVVLPAVVLAAWGSFHAIPQKPGQEALHPQRTAAEQPQIPAGPESREAVIASTERIPIDTPRVKGSISLRGGRIDDVSLALHRETVDPSSPALVLLSPPGGPHPFYAEFGWVGTEPNTKVPGPDTVWRPERPGSLAPGRPIALVYDNGEGLVFRRIIAVDDKYLFTLKDEVANSGAAAVTLFPYGLISRHGTPPTQGYYILHEGMIGVLGDQGLQEVTYKTIDDEKSRPFKVTNAWMGITDKYWATALMPDTDAQVQARFSAGELGAVKIYQTDYLLGPRTIAPGATATANARLFAGAKELEVVEGYERDLNLNRFELLIDLGWFHFITKPMYLAIDYLFHLVGNFGVAPSSSREFSSRSPTSPTAQCAG